MKIQIREDDRNFTLLLPTGLVFGRPSLWLINSVGRKYAPDALASIPQDTLEALWAEMRRIKRKYGRWDLVEVDSADGEYVKITL